MDPFHVVHLAGDALDNCRRFQQHLHGHRQRSGDPLYSCRRTLHTGTELLTDMIASLRTGVPTALIELRKLGCTLNKRAGDILAYFDRPGTALGFRNLENYITRSLLETGGFRPALHP